MSNRDNYLEEAIELASQEKNILFQWPTGFGKSRCALEIAKKYIYDTNLFPDILIVVPKLVLIDNWKDEIRKWLGSEELDAFTFTTYVSLYKHMNKHWDMVIFDECHHFTEKCMSEFQVKLADRIIALSATVRSDIRKRLYASIPNLKYHRISMRRAIEEQVLPDPTVFLIPLELKDVKGTFTYVKNPKGTGTFKVGYQGRIPYMRRKERLEIICTAVQMYLMFSADVTYWENRFKKTQYPWEKGKWMHYAGERLKWLSAIKTELMKGILLQLENCRTLTFCSTIEQADALGRNTIHSKTREGKGNLQRFNEGIENHITSVNMLNEGMNLASCQVGVFAGLTASETAQLQKLGRILRHEKPLIILPYFVNTRDEEIVNGMKLNYNPELIKVVQSKDINTEIKRFLGNETDN